MDPSALSDRARALLAFERDWPTRRTLEGGSKQDAVRGTFGISAARYYQLLAGLVDHPGAEAHDPLLVRRLRRRRRNRLGPAPATGLADQSDHGVTK